jgi:hypothetical protein
MYNNIKILTFATGKYLNSQTKLSKHLLSIGLDNQINLNENYLTFDFLKEYEIHLENKRGFGYWIWKPFIILNELTKLNKDEILIYIDSTDLPNLSFFDIVKKHFEYHDIFLINRGGYIHKHWTKRDCFIHMECDNESYHNVLQLDAGVIGVKNNDFCLNFINEWFSYMKNINILDDSSNTLGLPNLNGYKEHRHDQSILTNLCTKKNIKSINITSDVMSFNYNQP